MTKPNLLPGFGQSRTASDPRPAPTPEDPRKHEPVRDPPVYPDHDDGADEVSQADGTEEPDPSPDAVIFDAPGK